MSYTVKEFFALLKQRRISLTTLAAKAGYYHQTLYSYRDGKLGVRIEHMDILTEAVGLKLELVKKDG